MSSLLRWLDRTLSKSIPGTVLVLSGGALVAVGLLYGLALGLFELLASESGPTPGSAGGPFGSVGVVLLSGLAIATLGGQLVGDAREDQDH